MALPSLAITSESPADGSGLDGSGLDGSAQPDGPIKSELLTPAEPAPDFILDVLPTLSRAGCNVGKCHGSALGQGGFRLSLLGGDPRGDWERIARALRGRRVDLDNPAESLLLRKATRRTSHGGGRVLSSDSEHAQLLEAWINAGAPFRTSDVGLSGLRVELDEQGDGIEVHARYSDGSEREVQHLSRFTSLDDSLVEVTPEGELERLRPGRTAILVRYLGEVEVLEVVDPLEREHPLEFAVANFVDEWVAADLQATGKDGGPRCDDGSFVRRATLDLIGRLPTEAEARAFLADPDRDALVERLLDDPAFADLWAMRLAFLFPASQKLLAHLRAELGAERPWDQVAKDLLLTRGDAPGSAIFGPNDPSLVAENVSEAFLGLKIHCAGCHDHPFTSFRQRDYYSMSAFFARTRMDETRVVQSPRGEMRDPLTGEVIPAAFPGEAPLDIAEGTDRREPLADWIVEHDAFRRALVNRVWKHLLGWGFVEPTNDLRVSNPAKGESVLAGLADRFGDQGYSLRQLVGWIVRSESYQRLRDPRPLEAAVLHDAIADVLEIEIEPNRRAVRRPFQASELLDVSGRGDEDFEGSLEQALHLLRSPELESQISASPMLGIEKLYLRTLSRMPTAEERELAPRTKDECEDLLWALLNSREFLYGR